MTRATRTATTERTGSTIHEAGPRDSGTSGRQPAIPGVPDFAAIQHSHDFQAIRRRLRRFIFPMSALFCSWYLGYVLLAAYAHDFMSQIVVGHINMGLLLGLLQFVTTMLITGAYVYYMRKHIDPRVDELRARAGNSTQ
jgi:uncharacterized membrane protein (DUF485 family)